jgi:2-dehydro-3-deoxyphosphooctonate aldolase (KDO 8-P synthase)
MITYQNNNFFLIAGPCVVENEEITYSIAQTIHELCKKYEIHFFFKASYKKANRSSLYSFTGIGDQEALDILAKIKKDFEIPIVTDVHSVEEVEFASTVADVIQIPAFLSRQTELIQAAAKTGKIVNIKKGQFLSPDQMKYAVEKVRSMGNPQVMVTERGTTFGYHDLIVDYRGIKELKANECPTVLDCTHSLQLPNQPSGVTAGRPDLIETIAKAGIAVGFDGLFIETHPDPENALSDGANMLPLNELEPLLVKLLKIRYAILN